MKYPKSDRVLSAGKVYSVLNTQKPYQTCGNTPNDFIIIVENIANLSVGNRFVKIIFLNTHVLIFRARSLLGYDPLTSIHLYGYRDISQQQRHPSLALPLVTDL